jgi:hypothetical protein
MIKKIITTIALTTMIFTGLVGMQAKDASATAPVSYVNRVVQPDGTISSSIETTNQSCPVQQNMNGANCGGWYYTDFAIGRTLTDIVITGEVNLILQDNLGYDDNTLTVFGLGNHAGIQIGETATLNIFEQENQTGRLVVFGGEFGAGIGGSKNQKVGSINILGGDITASGGESGAGIGGGFGAPVNGSPGAIMILGGSIKTYGGNGAPGIGPGEGYMNGIATNDNIQIQGGTVSAFGGVGAAGIGCGYNCGQAIINITGGVIESFGGDDGSGIGGCATAYCTGINVNISGGDITVSGGTNGAGIGGGSGASGTGGSSIGAGQGGATGGVNGDVDIEGGIVNGTVAGELTGTCSDPTYTTLADCKSATVPDGYPGAGEPKVPGTFEPVIPLLPTDPNYEDPTDTTDPTNTNIPLTNINVAKTSTKLVAGGSYVIGATFVPVNATNKTVTWTSSKSSIAAVLTSGKVIAKTAGTTTITIKSVASPTVTRKVVITVIAKTTAIRTPLTKINLVKKKSVTLPIVVDSTGGKAKLTYKSSKTSIVTVNSSGKITAKKKGKYTATVKVGKKSVKVKVQVK